MYELLWNFGTAVVLVILDRRYRLGHGKVFALYVALYCLGRSWIEALRIDTVTEIGGFRLNNYTAVLGLVAALCWFGWLVRNRPGREEVVEGSPVVPVDQPDPELEASPAGTEPAEQPADRPVDGAESPRPPTGGG